MEALKSAQAEMNWIVSEKSELVALTQKFRRLQIERIK